MNFTMNNELLNCILRDEEELKKCLKWLTSQNDVGYHGFRKHDFVMFFLSYLRSQTAWLFKQERVRAEKPDWKSVIPVSNKQLLAVKPLSTGDTVRRLFSPENENPPANGVLLSPVKQRTNMADERQTYGNFQNVRRTPQKLFNHQSGHYQYVNAVQFNSNPLSPPNSNMPYGGQMAQYHTPRRTNYYNRVSSNSNSSSSGVLSPESPAGDYRKFSGGDRRASKNSCLSDFIVTSTNTKQGRGARKRIKPTRLPVSPSPNTQTTLDVSNMSKLSCDVFTRVPESLAADRNQSDRATKFDEERKLLKQYNSQKEGNYNSQSRKSRDEDLSGGFQHSTGKQPFESRKNNENDVKTSQTKVRDEKESLKEMGGENRMESGENETSVPITEPEQKFSHADPSKVIEPLILHALAEIYSVILDCNLVFNVTTEIHFVISLLAVNVAAKRNDNSDENSPEFEQNVNVVCEEKISGVDKLENCASPPPPANDLKDLLNDVHSSVYFACVVLEKQIGFLQLLDRRILKLLSENRKVELFAPKLKWKLKELYSVQSSSAPLRRCGRQEAVTDPESGICPVQFHVESDNRGTFSSNNSFATYRKQRDELYSILQEWSKMHRVEGVKDGPRGGGREGSGEAVTFMKVKTRVDKLLAMSQDPINIRHLAKHFCDLLMKAVTTSEENTVEELESLPDVNKSKLTLLTKRLTEPSSEKMASPRPKPNFPGFQQFYHDFLMMASQNFLFNVHLINCFVNEITARCSATYDIDESDGEGQFIQEETRQMFEQGLTSLCVLAKFLGLVVFAPYRSSSELPKAVLQEEINIRKQVEPPLKLEVHLNEAAKRGSLVYTVPWIVEYLGMMDSVAAHLPHYENVLVTLYNVYLLCSPQRSVELSLPTSVTDRRGRSSSADEEEEEEKEEELVSKGEKLVLEDKSEAQNLMLKNGSEADKLVSEVSDLRKCGGGGGGGGGGVVGGGVGMKMAPHVSSLLRVCLGWLFDPANLSQEVMGRVALQSDVERFSEEKYQTAWNKLTMDSSSDLVTCEIIHKFCPYLRSFHALLARRDMATAIGTVRHVTPTTSARVLISPHSGSLVPPEIALQLQLEDHFFMGQSESVKRTVEFVAERVASACIKHVIGSVVVGLKNKLIDALAVTASPTKKVEIEPLVSEYKTSVMSQLETERAERLGGALKALLGPDISPQTLDLCQLIAARKLQERVVHWLQAHINIEEILSKVITEKENNNVNNNGDDDALEDFFEAVELDQNRTEKADGSDRSVSIDEIIVCSKTLIHIQNLASDALETFGKQGMMNTTEMLELVSAIESGLKKCPSQPIKKQMSTALLDYVILAIAFQPEQVTDTVIDRLASVVSEVPHLWSQRNVMLLFQGQAKVNTVWQRFSRLTVVLIEKNALQLSCLEQQAVSLFRCTWPENVLKAISEGMQWTVADLKKNSRHDPEFLDLLSSIAVDISADVGNVL